MWCMSIHISKEDVKYKIPQAFGAIDDTHVEQPIILREQKDTPSTPNVLLGRI